MRLALVAVLAGVVGCKGADSTSSGSGSGPALGTERGDCRPDRTCDPGLLCLSNLCVRPPPADCMAIAETLTSFDLGNYAEPDERAPIVDKYKTRCEAQVVSKEAGECIDKATDKAAAMACAPTMFPSVGAADCTRIITKVRDAMMKQIASDPRMLEMMGKALSVMQQSCEQDGWPEALGQCALAAGDTTDALQSCQAQMPPELMKKIESRMRTAMLTP